MKPMTAKAISQTVYTQMMALAKATPATTGARLLVRVSLAHGRKSDKLRNGIFAVDTKERGKILNNTRPAMIQLTKWKNAVFFKVRVAV